MEISYLILGSNMGDRMDYIRRGIALLGSSLGTITEMSSVYESEPWGFDHPTWFLNQVVALETNLDAEELLEGTQRIEQELGRIRMHTAGYQARTIDIDILLYGNDVINISGLVIPHPRMAGRMFVLKPMAEIAPKLMHPVLGQTMEYLRNHCVDTSVSETVRRVRP